MEQTPTKRERRSGKIPRGVLSRTAKRLGVPINTLWYRLHVAKSADAIDAVRETLSELETDRLRAEDYYADVFGDRIETE